MLMKIKKLTKKSLAELNLTLSGLDDASQRECIGGGNGTQIDPWTFIEYQSMTGDFAGGWVDFGSGYATYVSPSMSTLSFRQGVVDLACSYIGVSEQNNPDTVTMFLSDVLYGGGKNASPSTPWCAAFASYIYTQCGITNPQSAAVNDWRTWGHETSNPMIGDVAIFAWSHIGIVVSVNGDSVTVISGNYSDQVKITQEEKSSLTFRTL